MIFDTLEESPAKLVFVTHPRARRGRGILFATAPFVVYVLAVSVGFVLALDDLELYERLKAFAGWGLGLAAVLAVACFLLGRRMRDRVEITRAGIRVRSTLAFGGERERTLERARLRAVAIDPSLRSLGADVLFVAVLDDGARAPVAEGEPHSQQVRQYAERAARILEVPFAPSADSR